MDKQIKLSLEDRGDTSEAGFALPIAIGVGLIMLLLGVTMVVRSQNDQVNASAQKATAKSLAAAESGVSRVQTFLNRYRTLAMYPDTGPDSWNNRNNLNVCPGDVDVSDLAALFPNGSGDWPNVDPSDTNPQPLNGEFRVLDYQYAENDSDNFGTPDFLGTLTVQGRINAGEPGESVSQVQVVIPVSRVNQVATLWAKGNISNSPTVEGTVVGDCAANLNVSSSTNVVRIDQNLVDQDIPNTPTLPDPSPPEIPASGPLGAENPPANMVYQYQIPTLNRSLEVWSGSTVELWTSGEINLEEQSIKCVQAGGTPCDLDDAFKVTIYALGASDIRLNEGSVLCNVHFHAPDSNVQFNSGGTPNGDCTPDNPSTPARQVTASFWVSQWAGGTNSVSLNPITNGPQVTAVLPPQLEAVSQWVTQQASP